MRQQPAPGHNVKIGVSLYADAIKAAEAHRMSVGQYVERAIAEQLGRDRVAWRVAQYHDAQREALRKNGISPSPEKFGLPRDFGIPPALRG